MTRRAGFGNDLKVLADDVEVNVAGMLQMLNDGRPRTKQSIKKEKVPNMENNAHSGANEFPNEVASKEPNYSRRSSDIRAIEKTSTQSPALLVNVTTRLTHAINQLLTDDSLRQRLKRTQPATRQEIIEEALRGWLINNGYLDPC